MVKKPEESGDDTYFKQALDQLYDEQGNQLEAAKHPLQRIRFKIRHKVKPFDMKRKNKSIK